MIEATQEKLPLLIAPALDRNAWYDECSLNLVYHSNTVQILLWWPEEKIMSEKQWTTETVLQVNSFIWGYHIYQEIWTADIGNE